MAVITTNIHQSSIAEFGALIGIFQVNDDWYYIGLLGTILKGQQKLLMVLRSIWYNHFGKQKPEVSSTNTVMQKIQIMG